MAPVNSPKKFTGIKNIKKDIKWKLGGQLGRGKGLGVRGDKKGQPGGWAENVIRIHYVQYENVLIQTVYV